MKQLRATFLDKICIPRESPSSSHSASRGGPAIPEAGRRMKNWICRKKARKLTRPRMERKQERSNVDHPLSERSHVPLHRGPVDHSLSERSHVPLHRGPVDHPLSERSHGPNAFPNRPLSPQPRPAARFGLGTRDFLRGFVALPSLRSGYPLSVLCGNLFSFFFAEGAHTKPQRDRRLSEVGVGPSGGRGRGPGI